MKDKLFIITKIIGLLVFILAFSSMGIASGKPIMILAYAAFFVIVMTGIFMFVKRNQRHFEIIAQHNPLANKIIGIALMLLGVACPSVAIANMQIFDLGATKVGFGLIGIVLASTIGLIAGCAFAVRMINKAGASKINKIIGYLIVVVLSAVPALLVMPTDRSTTGIGSVYYMAIMVAVLFWWGLSLYLNKE